MFRKLPPGVRAVILAGGGAILLFIVLAVVNGVIGQVAYVLFLWSWSHILGLMQVNPPLWVSVIPSWAILLAFIAVWLPDRINLRRSVGSLKHAITHMNNLDDTLVNCTPQLLYPKKPDRSLEDEVRSIVRLLLKQSTEAFRDDVHRAFFLLPDPTINGDYLKVWEDFGGIDRDSKKRKKFYIGKNLAPGSKRGIAGEAFYQRKLVFAHIIEDANGWKSDNEQSYICFDEQRKEKGRLLYPRPPYNSLVCVPLVAEKGARECIGVVCFDSNNPTIFDPDEIKHLLFLLAARLRAIMVIQEEVRNFFSKGQTQKGNSTV